MRAKKFIAMLLCVPAVASAEFWTGNDLYSRQVGDSLQRVQAMGYVMGIYDVGVHAIFCPQTESGITAGQVDDIVSAWLRNNPNRRHENAEKLVREAFIQVWPCAKNSGRGA